MYKKNIIFITICVTLIALLTGYFIIYKRDRASVQNQRPTKISAIVENRNTDREPQFYGQYKHSDGTELTVESNEMKQAQLFIKRPNQNKHILSVDLNGAVPKLVPFTFSSIKGTDIIYTESKYEDTGSRFKFYYFINIKDEEIFTIKEFELKKFAEESASGTAPVEGPEGTTLVMTKDNQTDVLGLNVESCLENYTCKDNIQTKYNEVLLNKNAVFPINGLTRTCKKIVTSDPKSCTVEHKKILAFLGTDESLSKVYFGIKETGSEEILQYFVFSQGKIINTNEKPAIAIH